MFTFKNLFLERPRLSNLIVSCLRKCYFGVDVDDVISVPLSTGYGQLDPSLEMKNLAKSLKDV